MSSIRQIDRGTPASPGAWFVPSGSQGVARVGHPTWKRYGTPFSADVRTGTRPKCVLAEDLTTRGGWQIEVHRKGGGTLSWHGQIRAGQSWPRLAYRREPQLPCGACGVNPTHCGNCIVYCVCNLAAQAPPEQISSPKYPGPHSAGGYGPSGKRQRHFPQSAPISNGVGCPGDFTLFTGLLLMVLACQEPKEQGEVCKILTNYFDVKLFI